LKSRGDEVRERILVEDLVFRIICCFATLAVLLAIASNASGQEPEPPSDGVFISCSDPRVVQAPYVWKTLETSPRARIEATMPGAYVRAAFREAIRLALVIDGEANAGCPAESMPVIEFSVDEKPYEIVKLTKTASEYALPLADKLDRAQPHRVDIFFRAADLTNGRWNKAASRLRLVGFRLNDGASVVQTTIRPKRAIGFGDSITEGVGVDGPFRSWQKLSVNNARITWLPMVAAALDAEYGQLGSGGQGMVRGLELPALTETWRNYDAAGTRLKDGVLSPPPDYIFCATGTNDFEKVITDDYAKWLRDIRRASPESQIFCIIPPLQLHDHEIAAAVDARRHEGDGRVHLVSTSSLANEYRINHGATRMSYDGVHPNVLGQAQLAAMIAVEVGRAATGN
jgi:lysophospholipase L1-like esterase